jgi:hypothetical protein
MERHFLGLQVEPVAPDLRALWSAWQGHRLSFPVGRTLPEVTVSAPAAGERLLVRYDLLVLPDDPDRTISMVDWKTAARPRSQSALQRDIQTRLYPFVLVEGGSAVAGREPDPDDVELIYWQAASPADPVRFRYSAADHEVQRRWILTLIDRARSLQGSDIPPVIDDLAICARCPYRTYCSQPVAAAPADPEPDSLEGMPADEQTLDELG